MIQFLTPDESSANRWSPSRCRIASTIESRFCLDEDAAKDDEDDDDVDVANSGLDQKKTGKTQVLASVSLGFDESNIIEAGPLLTFLSPAQ